MQPGLRPTGLQDKVQIPHRGLQALASLGSASSFLLPWPRLSPWGGRGAGLGGRLVLFSSTTRLP